MLSHTTCSTEFFLLRYQCKYNAFQIYRCYKYLMICSDNVYAQIGMQLHEQKPAQTACVLVKYFKPGIIHTFPHLVFVIHKLHFQKALSAYLQLLLTSMVNANIKGHVDCTLSVHICQMRVHEELHILFRVGQILPTGLHS